jgi:hypothetical protein
MKNREEYPGKIFHPIEKRIKMIKQAKKAYLLCGKGDIKGLKFYEKSQRKEAMLSTYNFILESMRKEQTLQLRIRYFARNLRIIRVVELPQIITNPKKYF